MFFKECNNCNNRISNIKLNVSGYCKIGKLSYGFFLGYKRGVPVLECAHYKPLKTKGVNIDVL